VTAGNSTRACKNVSYKPVLAISRTGTEIYSQDVILCTLPALKHEDIPVIGQLVPGVIELYFGKRG
jgi:hypothetical protein